MSFNIKNIKEYPNILNAIEGKKEQLIQGNFIKINIEYYHQKFNFFLHISSYIIINKMIANIIRKYYNII